MLYFISIFCKHCFFVITVYPSHVYKINALHSSQTVFAWTPAPSSLHYTNYTQIINSSVDHDQMAFDIQKEINVGSTRLNCYQSY